MKTIRIEFNVDDTDASMWLLLARLFGPDGPPQFSEDTLVDCSECDYLGPMFVAALVALIRLFVQ